MEADDFTRGTIDVEVWARIEIDAGVSSPRMTLSLEPFAGTSFGAAQYTRSSAPAASCWSTSPARARSSARSASAR